jgi:signal transduction histidine kinase
MRKSISKLSNILLRDLAASEKQVFLFGIIMFFNYPIYYILWSFLSMQTYENLMLRLLGSTLCLLLILYKFWPLKLKPLLPLYWYATVMFCLPFFFTFLLLKNNCSTAWLMNYMSTIYFLLLLFDALHAFMLVIIGFFLAVCLYCLSASEPFVYNPGQIDSITIIISIIPSFIIGTLFKHSRDLIEKEKLKAILVVGSNIAHELRTPLSSIEAGIAGIKNYLPKLIEGYNKAKNNGLAVSFIAPNHYRLLNAALGRIEKETHYANSMINMLLLKVKQNKIKNVSFAIHSMDACITEALSRYPFQEREKKLVVHHKQKDFYFYGDSILMVHVFFNLIKNSLYFIQKSEKGTINIWYDNNHKENRVHFKDTAMGIPKSLASIIFNKFNTHTKNGTGLGLSFCKNTIHSFGGDILCYSCYGEFAEFVISLPKLHEKELPDLEFQGT